MTARKYHNQPTEIDGIIFDSKREASRYRELKLQERAGQITDLVLQPRFPMVVQGKRICFYVGDFLYRDTAGGQTVEDVKGVATPVFRLKAKLFAVLYPDVKLEEVE